MTKREVELIDQLIDEKINLERYRSLRAESIVIFDTEQRIEGIKAALITNDNDQP